MIWTPRAITLAIIELYDPYIENNVISCRTALDISVHNRPAGRINWGHCLSTPELYGMESLDSRSGQSAAEEKASKIYYSCFTTSLHWPYDICLLNVILQFRCPGTFRIRLLEWITKHRESKKKSVTTLSIECSPQYTSKRPSSKRRGATRQQAIAKTHAKRSAYQIL
jgi:hypothetical protein